MVATFLGLGPFEMAHSVESNHTRNLHGFDRRSWYKREPVVLWHLRPTPFGLCLHSPLATPLSLGETGITLPTDSGGSQGVCE